MESEVRVFNYTDYREYLSEYYTFQKSINSAFSYRYFAQRAKIKSSGFYKEVVSGKRSLTRTQIHNFSIALKLNKKESEYFENMVYFSEAKSMEERRRYFKKMMSFYDSRAFKLMSAQYEYFSRWYYVAVRELLSYINFKDDYKVLATELNPPIREDQAKKAINILKKLKLIKKDKKGFYKRCDAVISTGYQGNDKLIYTMNIINFQKEMMDFAKGAYERSSFDKIDMSTLTLSISEENYKEMKEEIAQFRKKLLGMAEKDENPDRVYQLNHQFFPLTKK